MVSNSDYSHNILLFREMVERSASLKLYALEKEISRLFALQTTCQDEYLISLYGKKHYKDPRPIDQLKPHALDILDNLTTFLNRFNKDSSPVTIKIQSHYEEKFERYKCRKQELSQIIQAVSGFYERIRDCFVLEATLLYSERKKTLAELRIESDVKGVGLLSNDELLRFLFSVMEIDDSLTETLLVTLSNSFGSGIREAVIAKDEEAVSQWISGLSDKYMSFATEVSAISHGLQDTESVYKTVDRCIEVCKIIDKDYYLRFTSVADKLPNNLESFYTTHYKESLFDRLAREKGFFSKAEGNAILGKKVEESNDLSTTPVEKKEPSQQASQSGVDFFPNINAAIKDREVLDIIVDTIVDDFKFIADDPDIKNTVKYRFTGLPQYKLDNMPKIDWRINVQNRAKQHPGELLGLLSAVSQYGMFTANIPYLNDFFSFSIIKDGVWTAIDYKLPDPPHPYISKGDKFRNLLKEKLVCYPAARRLFD